MPRLAAAAIFTAMAERRYDDEETAAIFRAAAEGHPSPPHDGPREDGLTLADLQAIGREVGIAPEAVARAAHAVAVRPRAEARRLFGLPIGVSRTVELNRRLSDEEWERFVVQVREVFDARGRTASEGSLRQWTNGNLQVLLEPTESGHRVRFRTMHGGARASIGAGLMALAMAAAVTIAGALGGSAGQAVPGVTLMVLVGGGLIASGALRLPRWARLRGRQMEALAAGLAPPPSDESPPTALPPG